MSESILTHPTPPADARLVYGPDPAHFGDLRLPPGEGPFPVIVTIHGGFWRARYDLEHLGPLCAALTGLGVATWNIEYRRLGQTGGGWPGTFHDVLFAIEHLRHVLLFYPLDLGNISVLGHSAGGHLALWAASAPRLEESHPLYLGDALPLKRVIALAGVADLRRAWELGLSEGVVGELLGGSPAEMPDRYASASPIELLPLRVEQWLIHGQEDEIVPVEISRAYHEAARARGDNASLIELPGMGHFEPIDPRSAAWEAVREAAS